MDTTGAVCTERTAGGAPRGADQHGDAPVIGPEEFELEARGVGDEGGGHERERSFLEIQR